MALPKSLAFAALLVSALPLRAAETPDALLGTWIADGESPWTRSADNGSRFTFLADGTGFAVRDGDRSTFKYQFSEPNRLQLRGERGHDSFRFYLAGDSLMIVDGEYTIEFVRSQ